MLQIKTIIVDAEKFSAFDDLVNEAIATGWELVKRDVLPPYEGETESYHRYLYAELEREVEPEEPEDDGTAEWTTTRRPAYPFRCTACGCESNQPSRHCPNCHRLMVNAE